MRRSRRRGRQKPKAAARAYSQQRAAKADIERLGRHAGKIVSADNLKRIRQDMIRASDGTVYYRGPHGWMKTNGGLVELSDGTLKPLPLEPRPSKRDRAKMKRRLKREAV